MLINVYTYSKLKLQDASEKKKQVDINTIPEGPPGVSPSRELAQDTKRKPPNKVIQEPSSKPTKPVESKPQVPKPRSPAYTETLLVHLCNFTNVHSNVFF